MMPSPPPSKDSSNVGAPAFSFSPIFLVLSLLSSLVAWLTLYLPWSDHGSSDGLGGSLGTFSLDWAATKWSVGAAALLGLNAISSLLWLWWVTRVPSLLLWVIEGCVSLWVIVLTMLLLVQDPTLLGPWFFIGALVGMFLCNWQLRRRYPIPQEFITPHGEETLRPPI